MIYLVVGEIPAHTLSVPKPLLVVLSSSHVIPSYALPSLSFCLCRMTGGSYILAKLDG